MSNAETIWYAIIIVIAMDAQESTSQQDNRTLTSSGQGQLLLEWTSPARPFLKKSREYYTTSAALIFLLGVVFFLIQEWMAIVAMLAVAFVAYALSAVPPEEIHHRITTFGVENAGRRYSWMELYEFWFEEKDNAIILTFQTRLPFPPRIHLLLGEMKQDEVKRILEKYLPYCTAPVKTFVDRAASWISRKIPLETTV